MNYQLLLVGRSRLFVLAGDKDHGYKTDYSAAESNSQCVVLPCEGFTIPALMASLQMEST